MKKLIVYAIRNKSINKFIYCSFNQKTTIEYIINSSNRIDLILYKTRIYKSSYILYKKAHQKDGLTDSDWFWLTHYLNNSQHLSLTRCKLPQNNFLKFATYDSFKGSN